MTNSQLTDPEDRSTQSRVLSWAYLMALFLVLLGILGLVAGYLLQARIEQRRALALQEAIARVEILELQLNETMGAAYLMAGAIVQAQGQNPGLLVDSMAPLLLQQFPLAAAIQAAPNGVIRHSYPLKGNQEAIGHDLLVDPARNQEAHLAVSTRKLTLAGPFPLIQGGVGAVARFPVYVNNSDGWPKFWGFTAVVLRVPRLLEMAGVVDLLRSGYRYSFCRVRDENGCEVFAARGDGLPVDPVRVSIAVPNGQWILALSPEEGWWRPAEIAILAALCLALAAAHTALILYFFKVRELRGRRARSEPSAE